VSRAAKAGMDPQEYEQLKQERQRRPGRVGAVVASPAVSATEPEATSSPAGSAAAVIPDGAAADPPAKPAAAVEAEADSPGVLAIDDADDFAGDFGDDDEADSDDADEDDLGFSAEEEIDTALVPALADDSRLEIQVLPLVGADLPASAYMLVDKTVELQARPLSEFPELGRLPQEEQERQALAVYANPRQAKRQCGRTQRVIKLPDPSLLERTAPYLLAQGISRVVIEGALYALPGS
jgi:hypothetical protein